MPNAPKIDMLPTDDSRTVLPPTEEEYAALLKASKLFLDIAPQLIEVIEFTSETGLRRGEVFTLPWASVDLPRGAIRVEMQQKGRKVNGVAWRPKHNKWREVPLSAKALAVLKKVAGCAAAPEGLVFPNKGGAPYERMDRVEGVGARATSPTP